MSSADSYKSSKDFEELSSYLEENHSRREIDWEDIADRFYTLHQHYEDISLEKGSEVFRELKENHEPSPRNAEEVLFRYAVEDEPLETAIEAELEY
jgi:hypothetical protein